MKKILTYALLATILCGLSVGIGLNFYLDSIQQNSIANKVDQVIDSVVHIRHSSGWQGSGVIISHGTKGGIVLTAQHVLSEVGTYTVTLNSGAIITSKEACVSKNHDIGFIRLDTELKLPVSPIGNFRKMRVGEQLFAIGSPFGDVNFNSVTLGILSAKFRSINSERLSGWTVLFQSDVAANPGNSGCPIYNMNGEVVGVLVGGYTECVNYSVPIDCVTSLVDYARLLFSLKQLEYVEEQENFEDVYEDWNK
jgi:S1-C subfamily serine protease